MEKEHSYNPYPFLNGGGEMGEFTRGFNWAETAIGNPDRWPQSLRTIVSLLLSSRFPMMLWWGEEYIQFYNDAYRPSLCKNDKHPIALGQRGMDCWLETWDTILPMIQQVRRTGEATWSETALTPIHHNGKTENVYWTFSYSPVMGEDGSIDGVVVMCHESNPKAELFQELIKSDSNLRLMLLQAPMAIGTFRGPQHRIEIINPLMEQVLGTTACKLSGKPFFEALPEISTKKKNAILESLSKGESYTSEEADLFSRKNSVTETVYRSYTFEPIKSPNGTIEGVMFVAIDLTEQVLSRKRVEKSEQNLRSILKSAPFAIGVYTGREMKIEFANQAILDIFGKGDDVIGKSYMDILPELTHQEIFEQLDSVYTTGIPYHATNQYLEITINGKNQPFYFNYSFTPLYDSDHTIYGVMNTGADVTELNFANAQLEGSEAKFRSLIEQAPVATCLFTGPEMKIEVANEIMIGIWGKGADVIGKSFLEAVPELKDQPFLDILAEVYRTGIAYETKGAPANLLINGVMRTYYFDFTYKPIFNADGEVYGIMDMAVDVTDSVIANQRIREKQQQLLSLFEQSSVGIAILEKDNLAFSMANLFYGELVGRDSEYLIGKPLLEALPELMGQGFDQLLYEVIESGIPYIANEVSVNLVRMGKLETFYVDLVYQPYRENNDFISGVFVVATDVTQQVLSRKEVESSEAKLRSIISSAPAGIGLFVGREMIIEMPNQMFIDIVGKGAAITGKPLREVMPELVTYGQPFLKILDDVYTTGIMYQSFGDQVKIEKNGVMTYNYYNITYSPLFNEKGEVYAILDIAIDVTESVRSRQKVEDAEASLRGVVEMAELSTWEFDIRQNVFRYSSRFMDWLGFSEDAEKIPDDAYNPLPPEYKEPVAAAIAEAIRPGSTGIYKNEHPIINRITGQIRIIQAHAQVFYDLAGNPQTLRGSAQDVTKERELQQQLTFQVEKRTEELQAAVGNLEQANHDLQKSNSELAQFAYIASHDLQEPIRKISTFIRMLEDNIDGIDQRSKSYIDRIHASTERMTILIRDILGFSQLSNENNGFVRVNLNDVIQSVLLDFDLVIEQKQAVVHYNNLPIIDAIPIQMCQLFANLISNSLKYSKNGLSPVITISAQPVSEEERILFQVGVTGSVYYKIELQDNGIGFNPEYAEKIFNIFQRLHSKMEYAGTGIGLAMCKKIAQNHNGDIYALAQEKEGALFVILLPLSHIF